MFNNFAFNEFKIFYVGFIALVLQFIDKFAGSKATLIFPILYLIYTISLNNIISNYIINQNNFFP